MRNIRTTSFFRDRQRVRVAAISGAVLAVLITPFMATASFIIEEDVGPWSDGLLVVRVFGPWLESLGFLTFGPSDDTPYEVYGKAFFLVYLLMLPVIYAVRPHDESTGLVQRLSRWGWNVMFWAAVVGMVGDFLSYWGTSLPSDVGQAIWGGGFAIEILAMLAIVLGTLLFSIGNLFANEVPRRVSIVLLLAVVSLAPVNGLLTDYWPNGLIFPLSIGWAVIALLGIRRESPPVIVQAQSSVEPPL